MNYLLHLLLSQPDDEHYIGNMLGDFVKGPLNSQYSPGIIAGLRCHRTVDSFAERHPAFQRSKKRIDPSYGHYRGIMVDLFYDHFTARNWHCYATCPLEDFAQHIYTILQSQHNLPQQFKSQLPRMIERNWLVSYRHPATIGLALHHLSTRISRPNPLSQGLGELHHNYAELEQDCHKFILDARAQITNNNSHTHS